MWICSDCKGKNITQQISAMVDANADELKVLEDLSDFNWDDFFWCADCEDEAHVTEYFPPAPN